MTQCEALTDAEKFELERLAQEDGAIGTIAREWLDLEVVR